MTRFGPTPDQTELVDAFSEVLGDLCTPDDVRTAWTASTLASPRWREIAKLGALGTLATTDVGGMGMSPAELVLLMEVAGRFALPEPIVEHAAAVVPLLERSRDEQGLLAGVLSGDVVIALGGFAGSFATHVDSASHVMVKQDGRVLLAPLDSRVDVNPISCMDGCLRPAQIRIDPSTAEVVTDDPGLIAHAGELGTLATAAFLNGLSRRLLDDSVAYARERRQFGVPIGSFQAIKHMLADVSTSLAFSEPLVLHAGWRLAASPEQARLAVLHAKTAASTTARQSARTALQVHGALGYSFEHHLHMWFKRAWTLAGWWGDPRRHRREIAHFLAQSAAHGGSMMRS